MRERKSLIALLLVLVCGVPVLGDLFDPNTPFDPNSAFEIPLRFRGTETGWSIFVQPEDVSRVGVHVFGASNGTVTLEIDKWFYGVNTPDHQDKLILAFVKRNAQTTFSRFVIDDEYVVNNTNYAWEGYTMGLSPNGHAGFNCVPNVANDPSLPDGDEFQTVIATDTLGYQSKPVTLDFYNGVVSNVAPNNVFQPGYRRGSIKIVADPAIAVNDGFILKEWHTPEPISMVLFGVSGMLVWLRRR